MKKLLLISLLLYAYNLSAQSIKIEFEVMLNKNKGILSTKSDYYYIQSKNKSIYYNDPNKIDIYTNIEWTPEVIKNRNGVKILKIDDSHYDIMIQDYFYKDYNTDTLISNRFHDFRKKNIAIGESINLFIWEIIPNSDTTILNYKCKKAVTTFRGREYEAFFSEELACSGGPWKFDGLPGLILSVQSKYNYFIINPIKLSISGKSKNISNPYRSEKNIFSWEGFKTDFYNSAVKLLKSQQANNLPEENSGIILKDEIEELGFTILSIDDFK